MKKKFPPFSNNFGFAKRRNFDIKKTASSPQDPFHQYGRTSPGPGQARPGQALGQARSRPGPGQALGQAPGQGRAMPANDQGL